MMKKKRCEYFEKILLEKKRKLITRLTESSDKYHQNLKNDNVGDMADAAFDINERYLIYDLSVSEKSELKAINNALAKLGDNTYGICENCNSEISFERLKAQPFARLCIDCKTKEEANEKRVAKKAVIVEEET